MAIVFISPKAKQRTFLKAIITVAGLSLVIFFLVVLMIWLVNKNKNIAQDGFSGPPNITINFNVIDSDQVKNLEPFTSLETEFTYLVQDQTGKQVQGNISAPSKEAAQKLLEDSGMKIISIKETIIGNNQPFASY